jgi:hypothetical protein
MLIMCRRPLHLPRADAERWIQAEASRLLEDPAVARVRFTPLQSAALAWPRVSDWMLDVEIDPKHSPHDAVRRNSCRELLGDLRMLGMQPSVVVVGDAVELAAAQ